MDENQLHLLAVLIERYGSIIDGLNLLQTIYPNNKRISQIKEQLNNGKEINQILNQNLMEKQVGFYCQYLPVNISIKTVIERNKYKNSLKKELIGKISYQILLFFASIVLLIAFNKLVLPTMIDSLNIESAQITTLTKTFNILNIFVYVLLTFLAIIISFLFYVISTKKEAYLWAICHRYKKDKIFKIIGSYKLASNLKILLENSIPLENCLQILRYDQDDRLLAFIAHHYHQQFIKGNDFEKCLTMEYLDEQFTTICLYCVQQNSFSKGLEDYCLLIQEKIKIWLKKLARIIQIFSYSLVAIVIVMSYQVLMLPLEMLKEL